MLTASLQWFPHHTIPDGSVMYPHHLYIGLLLTTVIVWRVSDDHRGAEPVGVLTGSIITVFSFVSLWGTTYPVTGALGTLLGLTVASVSVLARGVWTSRGNVRYSRKMRAAVILGLLIAWDDALEHAFGTITPLDFLWTITNAAQILP